LPFAQQVRSLLKAVEGTRAAKGNPPGEKGSGKKNEPEPASQKKTPLDSNLQRQGPARIGTQEEKKSRRRARQKGSNLKGVAAGRESDHIGSGTL